MIPLDEMDRATPPPRYMLVERVEIPLFRGRIVLTDNVRTRTRSVEVIVHSAGEGVEYKPGDRLLLAHSAGIEIKFGSRGEKSLWKVLPSNVLCRVYGEAEISHDGISVEGAAREIAPDYEDLSWEEGDLMGVL